MKKFIITILAGVILFTAGCSQKEKGAATPEELIERLAECGNGPEILDLYSPGTVKLFDRFIEISGRERADSLRLLNLIPSEEGYRVLDKHCGEKSCSAAIQYTGEGMGNSRGLVVEIKMVHSSGSWKIDREDDLNRMIKASSGNAARAYIDRLREK